MASTYLTFTPSSNGNRKTYTFSAWVKRTGLGSSGLTDTPFGARTDANDNFFIGFEDDSLRIKNKIGGTTKTLKTSRVFRDTNAWYHIVVSMDTTQATDSNRTKIYINGTQETSFGTEEYPAQNADTPVNTGSTSLVVGNTSASESYHFDGSMSHVHFIDGTAYNADTFGETDSTTGIWIPKTAPSVTYGTNGFFLKFENSAAMGTDSSGNSNTFSVNGSMTQLIDTPDNVFATWNSLYGFKTYTSTYANGNTTLTTGSTQTEGNPATLGASSGKYYWEVKPSATSATSSPPDNYWYAIGAMAEQTTTDTHELGHNANAIGYYGADGTVRINDSNVATLSTYITGDIIGIALDLDNNLIYFYKNGAIQNSGTGISIPAASSTPFGFWFPAVGDWDNNDTYTLDANFGNGYFGTTAVSSAQNPDDGIGIFEYDVPAGYRALCTKSINAQEYS